METQMKTSDARDRLLAGIPVAARTLELNGISTSVLEGGDGPPIVLLHGPGENAAKWFSVMPDLLASWRVIAPDLPGHGGTVVDGPLDMDRVLAWLDALIARTCATPPVLAGQVLGGAIAARFATRHPHRIARLVLVDTLGLVPFRPAPEFEHALTEFLTQPDDHTHDRLMEQCMFDADRFRERLGSSWEWLRVDKVAAAREPERQLQLQALMAEFGMPAIPAEELARIAVPTTLIWGRHDRATRLQVAETANARYGWPLHIIDDAGDDPTLEQPDAFLDALRSAQQDTIATTFA